VARDMLRSMWPFGEKMQATRTDLARFARSWSAQRRPCAAFLEGASRPSPRDNRMRRWLLGRRPNAFHAETR
jgi:hypothetical protein